MADKLIFPIGFDLEAAVKQAQGDADRLLRKLETTIKSRPLAINLKIDNAGSGSINEINKRMSELVKQWNGLTEAERIHNKTTGEFTPQAKKIIAEYVRLTGATESYARSLQQITAAARKQADEQLKEQQRELKAYEDYWKRKEAESAKQAQADIAAGDRQRKAQQQRIAQEQTADAKRYQEWLRQKNQEAVETERVERQKQQSRERTIAQQNREFAEERRLQQQRQEAISASLRAEYQRIEAKRQAEAASRRELQMLNQQYAAEERRQKLAAQEARIKGLQKLRGVLQAEENTIANINAKLQVHQQRLQQAEIGSRAWRKSAEEVKRLTAELDKANQKMRELTGQTASGAAKQASAVRQVSNEFKHQDGYVSRLIKRLAVYAGFQQITGFLRNVREVTAQFELQRVSLGAIIQDQTRANALFSEIKQFALKSPVSIMDLTKYTKQVAAYRIETDKLFDTTKRLADVSVGLGVDMGRIVLAYGQVKAASYLRATEIRQFTEAGIPMLELLAEKFTKLNGEAVTTEQVMEMVSKRMVGFEMVEDIFNDMTSAGGMFYNMQEKQGNTLFGLWAKLGDAASMMYDEIGNTEGVNTGMKSLIQLLTDLMKNWRLVGREATVLGATLAILYTRHKLGAINATLAASATNQYAIAQQRLNAAQAAGNKVSALAATYSARAAIANRAAATSTNAWTAAQFRLIAATNSLKAAFLGNWITLTIAAIAAIGAAIYSAYEKAHKLQNELKDIESSGAAEMAKSVFNFERLANAALRAANGSKRQTDALEELKRTYKDIIPEEELTISNLRKMREEGYLPLTAAIKEYIAQRTLQKEIDAITSNYTEDTIAKQRQLRELFKRGSTYNFFKGVAWSSIEGLDDDQISQLFANVEQIAKDKSKTWQDVWIEAIKGVTSVSAEQEDKMRRLFDNATVNAQQATYNDKLRDIVDNTRNMATETDAATRKMDEQTGAMGRYGRVLAETNKSLEDLRLTYSNGNAVDPNTFLASQMGNNAHIKAWKDDIVEIFNEAGVEIKNEWFNIIQNLNAANPGQISSINFEPILDAVDAAKDKLGDKYIPFKNAIVKYQELYNDVVPTDRTVSAMRSRLMQIANNVDNTGGIMNSLQRHLMKSGDSWENYSKSIRDAVKDYEAQIDKMQKINDSIAQGKPGSLVLKGYTEEEINKIKLLVEALKQLFPFLAPEKSSSRSGRTQSDNRLSILQEMVSTLKQVNKEYDELAKKEGATKALADAQGKYANTFKYLQSLSAKYKFKLPDFGVPTDAKSLTKYLEAIKTAMAKLPKSEKAVLSLETDIADINLDDAQKKIEAQLKQLADRISRTKTAREFYDKILSQTGDVELAASVSMSIYGEDSSTLKEQMANYINELMQSGEGTVEIGLDVINSNFDINYKNLRKIAEEAYQAKKIGDDAYKELIKIADSGEADIAKKVDGWLKATEKAKSYSDKMLDLARTTNEAIAAIEAQRIAGNLPDSEAQTRTNALRKKQSQDEKKLMYEAFKDTPMYIQLFDDLDHASTRMLENMKARITSMQGAWKDLDPTQLKELQSRLNEIDEQLARRNPFKTLAKGIKDYRNLMKNGDARGNKSEKAAEKDLMATAARAEKANKAFDEALKKYAVGSETFDELMQRYEKKQGSVPKDLADAKKELDEAMRDEKAAQKAVENWKKVEKAIKLSATEMFQMPNWGGDIAHAIADISEAMGADEEDVQYWNDIASAFDDVAGGIQDIVNAAMSGDVIGIISSVLTAVPKMFIGFVNLFSAGKIKRANKEIKRQQELLDQLEYSYGRLEKAAEKLFGAEYISNYNRQLKNLQAQAEAYRKQAEAERSKGKKEDKEKTKEYENSYRNTLDEIADMQGQVAARMLGTDLTSAARDFAKAWLDAYKQFGNTADAMSEKFHEMIENMVVESLLAKVMKKALEPVFKMIDEYDGDFMNEDFWRKVSTEAAKGAKNADYGARTVMSFLEQAGLSVRSLGGEMTGISRDIASASEESINGLAKGVNTQNYYMMQISGNVAAMLRLMEGGGNTISVGGGVDTTALWNQHLELQQGIYRHTAETVAECRNIAQKCQEQTDLIRRVIAPRNSSATHSVQVIMK